VFELRDDRTIDLAALARLRARCEFADKPIEYLARQVEGARWIVHAHDGDRLVGFARAISDGVSTAYLSSVMVDPDHRLLGIGRAMIEHLLSGRDGIKFVLHARQGAADFYAAMGFVEAADMRVRERR
jgi:ribosomal protein S18 acetylase RimI-like enzyme